MSNKLTSATLLILVVTLLNSCVWRPNGHPFTDPDPPAHQAGINHTVTKGETLWSIATKYNVRPAIIRYYNKDHTADITDIKIGTVLFIPGVTPRTEASAITLPPVKAAYRDWKHIIVHHSATDMGCASEFDRHHRDRGWRGVGYDFVINNGTCGHPDGEIEVTPRWIKQQTGAHCKANGMNETGIGICLVGNFSKKNPSQAQLVSLINLIRHLQQQFKVPPSRVKGHGGVRGANTECPGKYFPWKVVRKHLIN